MMPISRRNCFPDKALLNTAIAVVCVMLIPAVGVLAQPQTSESRVLHFPSDRSLGKLIDLDQPPDFEGMAEWKWWQRNGHLCGKVIADARGDVTIPPDCRVGIIAAPFNPQDDMASLASLPPDTIEALWFDEHAPSPSDQCLASVCRMRGLKALSLDHRRITNEGLVPLKQLQSLEQLSAIDLNTAGMSAINQLRTLKRLRFNIATVTPETFLQLSNLVALQDLSIGTSAVAWKAGATTPPLSAALTLSIDTPECSGDWLRDLDKLPNLRCLGFYDLNGAGVAKLPPMPNLTELSIQYKGPDFTPEQMASLSQLTRLEELSIRGGYADEGLVHVVPLKRLRKLLLAAPLQVCQMSDATLSYVAGLHNLESLNIYVEGFTDDGLRHLSHLSSLRTLCIPNCRGFTDAGLAHIGKIKTLEQLKIRSEDMTNEGLKHLEGLTSLTALVLFPRSKATTEGLARLKDRLPNLAYIDNMRFRSKSGDLRTTTSAVIVQQSLPHLYSEPRFVQGQRIVLKLLTNPNPMWLLHQGGDWPYYVRINGRDIRSEIKWEMGITPTGSQQAFFDLTRAVGQSSESQQVLKANRYSVALVLKNVAMDAAYSSSTLSFPELLTNLVEFDVVEEGTPQGAELRAGEKYAGKTITEWVQELAAHDDADRTAAVAQLAAVGSPAVTSLTRLINKMDRRAFNAAQALINMGPDARSALPSLIKQAQRPRTPNRTVPDWDNELAISTLAQMKWATAEIMPVIKQIAEDAKMAETTRDCARRALESLAKPGR